MNSFFLVLFPCTLFVLSIWKIHATSKEARLSSLIDVVGVGLMTVVNAVACVWTASSLSAVFEGRVVTSGSILPETILFSTLALLLGFKDLVSAITSSRLNHAKL